MPSTTLESLQAQIDDLRSNVAGMRAQLKEVSDEVHLVKHQVTDYQQTDLNLKGLYDRLRGSVDRIEADNHRRGEKLVEISGQVTVTQTTVSALQKSVNDGNVANGRIEGALEHIKGRLTLKAISANTAIVLVGGITAAIAWWAGK